MQHGCTLNDRLLPVPSQLPLLRKRWKQIVFGALFQYCHGLATQLAHRMHRPMAQPLHDVGFALLPVRLRNLLIKNLRNIAYSIGFSCQEAAVPRVMSNVSKK